MFHQEVQTLSQFTTVIPSDQKHGLNRVVALYESTPDLPQCSIFKSIDPKETVPVPKLDKESRIQNKIDRPISLGQLASTSEICINESSQYKEKIEQEIEYMDIIDDYNTSKQDDEQMLKCLLFTANEDLEEDDENKIQDFKNFNRPQMKKFPARKTRPVVTSPKPSDDNDNDDDVAICTPKKKRVSRVACYEDIIQLGLVLDRDLEGFKRDIATSTPLEKPMKRSNTLSSSTEQSATNITGIKRKPQYNNITGPKNQIKSPEFCSIGLISLHEAQQRMRKKLQAEEQEEIMQSNLKRQKIDPSMDATILTTHSKHTSSISSSSLNSIVYFPTSPLKSTIPNCRKESITSFHITPPLTPTKNKEFQNYDYDQHDAGFSRFQTSGIDRLENIRPSGTDNQYQIPFQSFKSSIPPVQQTGTSFRNKLKKSFRRRLNFFSRNSGPTSAGTNDPKFNNHAESTAIRIPGQINNVNTFTGRGGWNKEMIDSFSQLKL